MSASAAAAITHPYVGSFGSFSNVQGIAVEAKSGDVYVYDGSAETIFKFDAAGAPVNFAVTGTNAVTGVGSASGGEGEIAVDSSSGPAKGDIYVAHADGSVNIYSEAGSKLGELTSEAGKPWGEACGVAVDGSGSVYVGLYSSNVNEYSPSANPVTDADYTSSLEGLSDVCNLAVDSTGNLFADSWSSGPVTRYAPDQFGAISASGSIVDSAGSTLAVDPANDEVYVDEQGEVAQFGAHGEPFEAPTLTFASSGSGAISGSTGIAVSGFNDEIYVSDGEGGISVFGAAIVVPDVATGAASNIAGTSATLNGTVNPSGLALSECKFEYGLSEAYDHSAPCAESTGDIGSGSAAVEVHADVSGLSAGASYHFRLVAENANGASEGEDETFATPAPPAIDEESFSGVANGEAIVSARIDPDNAATTYHVEYGAGEGYGSATAQSETIGSDNGDHAVSVHLVGLSPGVTYHFRFVASNALGVTDGADMSFSTYAALASAGSCENEARRDEQNVGYLPDCRAYEMVSPLDKNGSNVIGNGRTTAAALGGDRVAYGAYAGFGETSGSGVAGITQYMAVRHEGEGWESRGITPTPAQVSFQFLAGATGVPVFSSELTRGVVFGYDLPGGEEGIPQTGNLYLENLEAGSLETITVPQVSGFSGSGLEWVEGSSSDLGVVTFESSANFIPEAEGFENKLYAWEHGAIKLVGVLPGGELPTSGVTSGHPGIFNSLENEDAISRDGSRIVFLAKPNGGSETQLYLRKDASSTAWVSQPEMEGAVSEPASVMFDTMTPDGSRVLFATKSRLLEADPGGEAYGEYGLYMYTDGPQPQTEANLTFLGRINTEFGGSEVENVVLGTSEDASRVYFFTREDEEFAQAGIYLWEDGSTRLVTPTSASPEEPQISTDGNTLAFVAREQLTQASVANAQIGTLPEMYVYHASANTLACASCLPTGGTTTAEVELMPKATKSAIAEFNGQFQTQFLSSEGDEVFFTTASRLVPSDANGRPDVYEYDVETGQPTLLSTGTGEDGAWLAATSEDGSNVFILTGQQLLASDTDNLVDLYDVRVNGGFVQPKPSTGGCVGDECQGTPSAAPTFNTASGFSGLGNVVSPSNKASVKRKSSTSSRKLAQALRACKHKPRSRRVACRRRAQRRFGHKVIERHAHRALKSTSDPSAGR
ncbi:MAG TPA: hypothetical protein VGF95_08085 [Solirubrobacteraceae bacterium]